MERFAWDELDGRHGRVHLVRAFYRPGREVVFHRHDFAEVCWLESGRLKHRLVDHDEILEPGDGLVVAPEHGHGFRASGESAVLVNLAFPARVLTRLTTTYGEAWPLAVTDRPRRFHLEPVHHQELVARLAELGAGPGDDLELDAFLLDLARRLRPDPGHERLGNAPGWLRQAVVALAQPPLLAEGVTGLANLCRRSREHVARVVRRACGCTATALVQDLRLAWLSRELRLGDRPFGELASEAGAVNHAHLHRLFVQRFGLTPGAYRRRLRRLAVSGG